MTDQKLVKYYGIAAAHGIESFLSEEQLKEDSLEGLKDKFKKVLKNLLTLQHSLLQF